MMATKQIIPIGTRFGNWKIIGEPKLGDSKSARKSYAYYYLCECQCEKKTQKWVKEASLKSGKSTSCGCAHSKDFSNWIGQEKGKLLILEEVERYISPKGCKDRQFKCRCLVCDSEIVMRAATLRNNPKGCVNCKFKRVTLDLTDKIFGRLRVKHQVENKVFSGGRSVVQWLCYCDPELGGCGNWTKVTTNNLTMGKTQSCGCLLEESNRGEKQWNWKGGITSIYDKIRNSVENLTWKQTCKARDMFTCQKCQVPHGDLETHHIIPYSELLRFALENFENPADYEGFWNLENGITLCASCHQAYHGKYKNNICKESLQEWLSLPLDNSN